MKRLLFWLEKLFGHDPDSVYMNAEDWMAIIVKLERLNYRNKAFQDLLDIIKRNYFSIVGERVADIDGGPALCRISIPVHLHQHLEILKKNN